MPRRQHSAEARIAPCARISYSRRAMKIRNSHFTSLGAVFLFAAASARGLDPSKSIAQYGLDSWLARDGLPQNSASTICQTRNGYLWFGTEEGLVRFDGVRFSVYSTRNTPAFRENTVEALAEGTDGSLWVGTTRGLLRKSGERFKAYGQSDGLPDDSVLALLADRDGTLWIGTERRGLAHWSRERFLPSPAGARGLPSEKVTALARSRDGALWAGTDRGLARLQKGEVISYRKRDGLPSDRITDLRESRDGSLWVGTAGGLARISDGRVAAVFTARDGLTSDNVGSLFEDRDGSLWIGTRGGLCRLRNGAVERFTSAEGLPNDVVTALFEDHEGSIWFGTDGGGLSRLWDGPIISYTIREGLSNDFVWPVLEDAAGTIWVGTRGGGLNRLRDGRFSALTARDGLPLDSVSALSLAREGGLWIGTSGGVLARWQEGRVTFSNRKELPSRSIRVLLEDRHGALWIGTDGGGLVRLDKGRFSAFSSADGLAGETVNSLCEDAEGSLWIGTLTGLSRWKDGGFVAFREKDGLASDSIRALHADSDGTLWIGTSGGGLMRFSRGRFGAVTVRQGLFDDVVFAILDDARGNLWMSCNHGIFRVARKELDDFFAGRRAGVTSVSYGEADGMKSAECNGSFQPAGWRSHDGRLWFSTIRGVAVVDPAAIHVNTEPPPVVLERIVADGRDYGSASGQRLPAGTRSIELHYTGLSFLGAARVQFQYRLDDFDADWVDVGTRRVAYYTNVPPGRYVFRVIACNRDGVWNRVGAALPLTIAPRLTETRLFWGTVAAVVVGLGFAAYRLRVRSLQAQARELEAGIQVALSKIRVLRGLFPICASCKKIRDDKGYWSQIESYIRDRSEAEFSHSICPECAKKLYPEYAEEPAQDPTGGRDSG
jgi:ligand-binding sensor domain-containing protein